MMFSASSGPSRSSTTTLCAPGLYSPRRTVDALLVPHPHHADAAGLDDSQRIYRLLTEHQYVQRIAIVTVGPRNESVISRVVHRAVEDAVQPQQTGLLVQLVLVGAAFGNF